MTAAKPRLPKEGKVASTLGFILHLLLVAIPKDIASWLRQRPKRVAGETIVITGGGSGIGARLAEIFALEHAANVAVLDINEAAAERVAAAIRERRGVAAAFACDVTSAKQMEATAAAIRARFGRVNIIVCNAAVLYFAHALELTAEQMQMAINVNISGVHNTIRAFLEEFEAENRGQIVAVSSIAGFYGETFGLAYCPTKFAVRGLMECLQMEYCDRGLDGIKCTTLCPYFVRTPMILKEHMRPTSRFIPFMSIDRCCTRAVDAILKEKVLCFIPGYIFIMAILKNLMSYHMQLSARNWLNCRYVPTLPPHASVPQRTAKSVDSSPPAMTPPPSPTLSDEAAETQPTAAAAAADVNPNAAATVATAAAARALAADAQAATTKKSALSVTRPPLRLPEMSNFFRVSHFLWWITIPPALAFTFVNYLGPFGTFAYHLGTRHNTLVYWIFVGAVVAHLLEAVYVLYLCDALGFTHKCMLKWFVQTTFLGLPSTVLIRGHYKRVNKQKK